MRPGAYLKYCLDNAFAFNDNEIVISYIWLDNKVQFLTTS